MTPLKGMDITFIVHIHFLSFVLFITSFSQRQITNDIKSVLTSGH